MSESLVRREPETQGPLGRAGVSDFDFTPPPLRWQIGGTGIRWEICQVGRMRVAAELSVYGLGIRTVRRL